MKIGIVGLPNVGKSTLFQTLTQKQVDVANYPFATIEPNVGMVAVPDERLTRLAAMAKSKKAVPATVEFVDIAGLVKGANKGEGLGNQFLHNIREVDAIVEVVRDFESSDIIHVEGSVDPERDMEVIMLELALKDLETINNHLPKIERMLKGAGSEEIKKLEKEIKILSAAKEGLERGTPLFAQPKEAFAAGKNINLLTAKPFLYLINCKRAPRSAPGENFIYADLKEELEIASLSPEEKSELDVKSGLDELIKKSYKILNLISFFTAGEKEARAWTITRGQTAKQAGGVIHSDFAEKFIRAHVIFWEDLVKAGGWAAAREKGLVRLEGKDYPVKDGEVMEFKI